MRGQTVNVLLVEDDEVDRQAIRRAFKERKIGNPTYEARDGLEALDVLRGHNGRPRLARPYLILLDLNMPRMTGLEFLEQLRGDAGLRDSIVFVLTTSREEQDRIAAYDLNVAGYMLKSDVGQSFIDAVTMLEHYWTGVVFPAEQGAAGRGQEALAAQEDTGR
jgi:CheY-like chemotaxis protein